MIDGTQHTDAHPEHLVSWVHISEEGNADLAGKIVAEYFAEGRDGLWTAVLVIGGELVIVIAGTIRIEPSTRDAAVAAAIPMMEATRAEAGCISYIFSLDLSDGGIIHLFEEWESQDALDAHFKMPHMAEFQGKVASLGVKGMDVKRYEVSKVGPLGG